MKRMSISLLCVIVLFLLLPTKISHAAVKKSVVPTFFDCTTICVSKQQWDMFNTGASAQWNVYYPKPFTGYSAIYQQLIDVRNTEGGKVEVGIEKTAHNNSGECQTSMGAFYYTTSTDDLGNHYAFCNPVPSGDWGKLAQFLIYPYSDNNGGGMTVQVYVNGYARLNENWPIIDTGGQKFAHIKYIDQILDTVIGHEVFGGNIFDSIYYDINWQAQYQTTTGTLVDNNPPQLYWDPYPSSSNYGGTMWTCVYANGGPCVIGSQKNRPLTSVDTRMETSPTPLKIFNVGDRVQWVAGDAANFPPQVGTVKRVRGSNNETRYYVQFDDKHHQNVCTPQQIVLAKEKT